MLNVKKLANSNLMQANIELTGTEFFSAVVKIPWHYQDFPWPLLFSMTFQAWKMVLQNFRTFEDQLAFCIAEYLGTVSNIPSLHLKESLSLKFSEFFYQKHIQHIKV